MRLKIQKRVLPAEYNHYIRINSRDAAAVDEFIVVKLSPSVQKLEKNPPIPARKTMFIVLIFCVY